MSMKSIKSRYSIAQVNNNYYETINVGSKTDSALESGYIWVPYIIQSTPFGVIFESTQEKRKSVIKSIIDKL